MNLAVLTNFEGVYGMDAAIASLKSGRQPLDAVELGIREVESNPSATTVGFGGAPNAMGEMELDAAVMDGNSLNAGSVGALKGFSHPVSVARKVMELLPHVMLVGKGAECFAEEIKAERGENLADSARRKFMEWQQKLVAAHKVSDWRELPLIDRLWSEKREDIALGTTVFIVFSKEHGMAGGTSTSGWAYKYPGRLGDSPIIGAGLYVDRRYGAAACTHTGEMTIRTSLAHAVVMYMRKGATVRESCYEALDDLSHLREGVVGPVVIHAMDRSGNPFVLYAGCAQGAATCDYCYWNDTMTEVLKTPSTGEPYKINQI